uniref:Odorant-binding protein 7 n=1 Tax=Bombyx mori TaxID=7091 RepID=B8ZWK7_BOMMO|nr:odorant-binding protein 7 precursor [Bombyx mori]
MANLVLLLTFVLMTLSMARLKSTEAPKSKTALFNDQDNMGYEELDMEEIMSACNESFRIEYAYLESLNDSGSFPDETDKTPKCYIRCVLEKTEILSENGVLNPATAALVFAGERNGKPMSDLEEMAVACADRHEKCKCEKAYNFVKCLMYMEIDKYEKKN